MTREDAIEILENTTFIAPLMVDVDTALDMAISALSADGDLISRQAIFDRTVNRNSIWNKITDSEGNNLEDILNSIPSVENKGEWEIYIISMLDGEGCKCSECGFEGVPYWNYCPNCGADMRGGQDGDK